MKIRYMFPLILAFMIGLVLWRGLGLHPEKIPSPLIGQPAPEFSLPVLGDATRHMTQKDLLGHVTVLNVWASWCPSCAEEHDFLLSLAHDNSIVLYGLDYKDEAADAAKLLKVKGNPYQLLALDPDGRAAIDWGVYGTPETFVIDQKGIIRYKQIGTLTPEIWETKIKPVIEKLRGTA